MFDTESVICVVQGEAYLVVDDVRYDLIQFHFHALSEHTIDGADYPLELHFVHASANTDVLVVWGIL